MHFFPSIRNVLVCLLVYLWINLNILFPFIHTDKDQATPMVPESPQVTLFVSYVHPPKIPVRISVLGEMVCLQRLKSGPFRYEVVNFLNNKSNINNNNNHNNDKGAATTNITTIKALTATTITTAITTTITATTKAAIDICRYLFYVMSFEKGLKKKYLCTTLCCISLTSYF